eukprot:CAMPEP_0201213168 /NCGR_PEP_ID=MMETSP0851-20130426/185533_1 /ASSEMBLY_ACC=CAM_ASM_000631 /TAXON_ID=183588 /ORGANISM="Pseudo-nitzschia fraudulenta, Strain WWA7" /LENGTH=148 /DNA_ID=CAMNT_0047502299 /DNA_START=300 /DNA_END=746 /DNA_ORIENTATION=+
MHEFLSASSMRPNGDGANVLRMCFVEGSGKLWYRSGCLCLLLFLVCPHGTIRHFLDPDPGLHRYLPAVIKFRLGSDDPAIHKARNLDVDPTVSGRFHEGSRHGRYRPVEFRPRHPPIDPYPQSRGMDKDQLQERIEGRVVAFSTVIFA